MLLILVLFRCDIPRTPHRRAPDLPTSGSRTAPRTNTATAPTLNSSIVGIGMYSLDAHFFGVFCHTLDCCSYKLKVEGH